MMSLKERASESLCEKHTHCVKVNYQQTLLHCNIENVSKKQKMPKKKKKSSVG